MSKLQVLENQIQLEKETIFRLNEILDVVCRITGTTPNDLKSKRQTRAIADARCMFWHITSFVKDSHFTLNTLGSLFNRDHATVLYGRKKALALLEYNAGFKKTFKQLAIHFAIIISPMTHEEKQAAITLLDQHIEMLKKWLVDHHDNPYRQKILSDLRSAEDERKRIETKEQHAA